APRRIFRVKQQAIRNICITHVREDFQNVRCAEEAGAKPPSVLFNQLDQLFCGSVAKLVRYKVHVKCQNITRRRFYDVVCVGAACFRMNSRWWNTREMIDRADTSV